MTTLDQSFSTRQVPWAKIGTVIDDPDVDSAEAARLGGIDFDVQLRPSGFWTSHEPALETGEEDTQVSVLDADGRPLYFDVDDNITTESGYWTTEPSRLAVVHADTQEWFSYVSTDYRPVQYREAFEFMDELNPRYVAAGALSGGRKGFMVVQLPDHMRSTVEVLDEEDPHDVYVVLQTSHDLSKGITVSLSTLRNRCMNMLVLPTFDSNAPQSWTIRHIGNPHEKLREAQLTLTRTGRYQEIFERTVEQLASVRVTSDDLRQIARRVLPSRLKTVEQQVAAIVNHFEHDETVGFRDTGWGAVNAMSTYLQWGRATAIRTAQSEFTSPLEGDAAKYVNNTMQLVMARA
jgi:phage/plasmid-like protein (TIGR03299 family)